MKVVAIVALGALAGACKDAQDFTERLPAQQRALAMKMQQWMPLDVEKAWQGAWLIELADDAPPVAIDVRGTKAVLFDGVTETQVEFRVIAPCTVAFGKHEVQFLIDAAKKIRVGRGAAGMRKGDNAIACGDGRDPGAPEEGVYLVEGNRCATWKRDAQGEFTSKRAGVCAWANARGDDLLDVGTEHYASTLVVKGDVLEERAFTRSAARNMRATSWDAAKTSAKGNVKPTTRLDAARDAGGRVGDTRTIAGLHATYAANPAPLVGLDLEITGTLVETSTQTVRGKQVTVTIIADPANPKAMQLACETAGAVTNVKPGDTVTVRGAIDTRQDHARLIRCGVTKAP